MQVSSPSYPHQGYIHPHSISLLEYVSVQQRFMFLIALFLSLESEENCIWLLYFFVCLALSLYYVD